MARFKYPVLLSYGLVLLFACSRPEEYYINHAAVKKSASFKEGSYFIYRDSVSGATDSTWIYLSQNLWHDENHGGGEVHNIETQEYFLMNKDSIKGNVRVWA